LFSGRRSRARTFADNAIRCARTLFDESNGLNAALKSFDDRPHSLSGPDGTVPIESIFQEMTVQDDRHRRCHATDGAWWIA
jgi:hypothetical protein